MLTLREVSSVVLWSSMIAAAYTLSVDGDKGEKLWELQYLNILQGYMDRLEL